VGLEWRSIIFRQRMIFVGLVRCSGRAMKPIHWIERCGCAYVSPPAGPHQTSSGPIDADVVSAGELPNEPALAATGSPASREAATFSFFKGDCPGALALEVPPKNLRPREF
jgi:hypothetical protein